MNLFPASTAALAASSSSTEYGRVREVSLAEACSRWLWSVPRNTFPLYARSPSNTAFP